MINIDLEFKNLDNSLKVYPQISFLKTKEISIPQLAMLIFMLKSGAFTNKLMEILYNQLSSEDFQNLETILNNANNNFPIIDMTEKMTILEAAKIPCVNTDLSTNEINNDS